MAKVATSVVLGGLVLGMACAGKDADYLSAAENTATQLDRVDQEILPLMNAAALDLSVAQTPDWRLEVRAQIEKVLDVQRKWATLRAPQEMLSFHETMSDYIATA